MKFEKHPELSIGAVLKFGNKTYEGLSRNIKDSRLEATKKAMRDYKLGDYINGADEATAKSPISQLNELAQKLNEKIIYNFTVKIIGNYPVFMCSVNFSGFSVEALSIRKQDCKIECAIQLLEQLNKHAEDMCRSEYAHEINTADSDFAEIVARDYQEEIYNKAIKTNIVACMETGCGKTFIAVLLIKHFSKSTIGEFPKAKRIVLVVPTVTLVFQQSYYIRRHTNLNVGFYCGETASSIESLGNWKREISNNHVLVLTAELFRQLLQYAVIDISQLCLLILDECHHGFNAGHPYNVIMTLYHARKREDSENVPRILGLTASPAFNSSLDNLNVFELKRRIEKLEQIFDSQCITSVEYIDSLKSVVSCPKISLVLFQDGDEILYISSVLNLLQEYKSKIILDFDLLNIYAGSCDSVSSNYGKNGELDSKCLTHVGLFPKNIRKCLISCFYHSKRIVRDLGIYALDVMLVNMLNAIKGLLRHKSYRQFRPIFMKLKTYLDSIHNFVNVIVEKTIGGLSKESFNFVANTALFSNKLQNLLLLISKHYIDDSQESESASSRGSTLILVAERSTCVVISKIINQLARKEAYARGTPLTVVSEYVVGATNGSLHKNLSDGIISVSMKTNNMRLEKFHRGVINVMVATNVLEEGIYFRSCDAVIRFDKFATLHSYIQSKGLIGQKDSIYYVFSNEKYKYEIESRIFSMANAENCIQKILSKYCLEQPELNLKLGYFEELEPQEHTFITSKTQIDLRSAVSYIFQFCDRFTRNSTFQIKPRFYELLEESKYRCYLRLPSECGVYTDIFSNALTDKKLAKQHCALKAIKLLYKMGKIEENLFPKHSELSKTSPDPDSDEKNEVESNNLIRGSFDYHKKAIPATIMNVGTNTRYFVYKIEFSDHTICEVKLKYYSSLDLSNDHIGLLVPSEIKSVSFPLASSVHSIQVQIRPQRSFESNIIEQNLGLIQEFNKLLFEVCLKVVPESCVWTPEKCHYSLWVIIFDKNGQPDIDSMNKFIVFTKQTHLEIQNLPPLSRATQTNNNLTVIKNYSDKHNLYHVVGVNEVLPDNYIQGTSQSYRDYFFSKHSKDLDENDVMLSCYIVNFDLNFLHTVIPITEKGSDYIYFPASCAIAYPFSFNLLFQLGFVPSLLKRLVDFLVVDEWCNQNLCVYGIDQIDSKALDSFVHNVSTDKTANNKHISEYLKIGFEKYFRSLSAYWNYSDLTPKKIHFKSVFQAFTHASSKECCNYERMELLGDCFLKFIVTMILFVLYPSSYEGFLTEKKSRLVSNDKFAQLGTELNVEKVMNSKDVKFGKNWCPPGFEVFNETFDGTHNDVILYQHIPRKSVADVVESLVGCCLISSNILRVYEFLLKLNIMEDKTILNKLGSINDLLAEYRKLEFNYSNIDALMNDISQLETIIKYAFVNKRIAAQALTHLSAITDTRQESYERLEFLGDSVIGFIIVLYLYLCHDELKLRCFSPGIITHLESALVNNKILGVIAAKNSLLKFFQTKSYELHLTLSHFANCVENLDDFDDIDEVPYLGFVKKLDSSLTDYNIPTIEVVPIPKSAGDLFEAIVGAVFVDTNCDLVLTAKIFMPFFQPYIQKYLESMPIHPKIRFIESKMNYKKSFTGIENNMKKCTLEDQKDSKQYMGIAKTYDDADVAACYALMKFGT